MPLSTIAAGEEYVIRLYRGAAVLAPSPDPQIVEDIWSYARQTIKRTSGGYRAEPGRDVLYSVCEHSDSIVITIPHPLVPLIRARLREHGARVQIVDERDACDRVDVDQSVVEECGGDEAVIAQAVKEHPYGQIEVQRRRDMLGHIALICRLYSRAGF